MFGFKPKIGTSSEMICRDEGIFVKTMFEFKKSCAKLPHKQKNTHEGCHISKVNAPFVNLLTSLTIGVFLSYGIKPKV